MFSAFRRASCSEGQILTWICQGYHQYWNYAVKKGYSGTAMFTKQEPLFGVWLRHWHGGARPEGRVITAEFPEYYVVTVYTPNFPE